MADLSGDCLCAICRLGAYAAAAGVATAAHGGRRRNRGCFQTTGDNAGNRTLVSFVAGCAILFVFIIPAVVCVVLAAVNGMWFLYIVSAILGVGAFFALGVACCGIIYSQGNNRGGEDDDAGIRRGTRRVAPVRRAVTRRRTPVRRTVTRRAVPVVRRGRNDGGANTTTDSTTLCAGPKGRIALGMLAIFFLIVVIVFGPSIGFLYLAITTSLSVWWYVFGFYFGSVVVLTIIGILVTVALCWKKIRQCGRKEKESKVKEAGEQERKNKDQELSKEEGKKETDQRTKTKVVESSSAAEETTTATAGTTDVISPTLVSVVVLEEDEQSDVKKKPKKTRKRRRKRKRRRRKKRRVKKLDAEEGKPESPDEKKEAKMEEEGSEKSQQSEEEEPVSRHHYPAGCQVRARFAYEATDDEELSMEKGDVFEVLEDDGEWLTVRNAAEKEGFVPREFCEKFETRREE